MCKNKTKEMSDIESNIASASLSSDLYDNIKKWKVEKQELEKQLEDYRKERYKLQAKVDQETSKYDYENNINIQAQDDLKMSQIKMEKLSKAARECLISVDGCKDRRKEIEDSILRERQSYREWQSNWEERVGELTDKFQSASDLYNGGKIPEQIQNLRDEIEQQVKNKQWLDDELLDAEKKLDNQAKATRVLDTEIQFLITDEAKHAHEVLDQVNRGYGQLMALFERLHKQTKEIDAEFSTVENVDTR